MSKSAVISVAVIAAVGLLIYAFVAMKGKPEVAPPPKPAVATEAVPKKPGPSATATVQVLPPPSTGPSFARTYEKRAAQASQSAGLAPPEPGSPVKDVEAALRAAADQGDPRAACRLGVELIRCTRLAAAQAELKEVQTEASTVAPDSTRGVRYANQIAEMSRTLAENQWLCSGVSPELVSNAWRYVYAAANAGSVAAMSRFVRDPGLGRRDPNAAEGWEAYNRSAPDFLLSAIEAGDIRALHQAWSSAWNGRSASPATTFQRDPDKALQYGTAVVSLVDPRRAARVAQINEQIAKEIGPERAAAARKEGDRLRAAHFANAEPVQWTNDDRESDINDCWK